MYACCSVKVGELCRKRGGPEGEKAERKRMVLEPGQREKAAFEAVQRLRKEGFRKVNTVRLPRARDAFLQQSNHHVLTIMRGTHLEHYAHCDTF